MNILFFLKPKSELAFIYDYHTLTTGFGNYGTLQIYMCPDFE